jgi:Zn-dependent oligopeptidase
LELKQLREYFKLNEINSYDLSYYSTKLKEEKYQIDDKELKKYFELENVLTYLFQFVKHFYSLELKQINTSSYNDDVRIYEVYKS